MTVQPMEDASPTKSQLAHTSWFFEQFILRRRVPGYVSPDDRFAFLSNSYYVQTGPRHARSRRGLITRPDVAEVMAYRAHVDAAMDQLLADPAPAVSELAILGCHHEMQHQELLLTDLLHALSFNPLMPAIRPTEPRPVATEVPLDWIGQEGHPRDRHAAGDGKGVFAFDCEAPRHEVLLQPFRIASRPRHEP